MTDPFAEHRDLLFTVAYEMLGSAADAEDVVLVTDGGGIKKAALRPIVAPAADRLPAPRHRLSGTGSASRDSFSGLRTP